MSLLAFPVLTFIEGHGQHGGAEKALPVPLRSAFCGSVLAQEHPQDLGPHEDKAAAPRKCSPSLCSSTGGSQLQRPRESHRQEPWRVNRFLLERSLDSEHHL